MCNGIDLFKKLYPVLLGDNGREFSNPTAIECDCTTGEIRMRILIINCMFVYNILLPQF